MSMNKPPGMVEVELHSTDPSAVEAVRGTLDQLHGGPWYLVEQDGKWYIPDGFCAFACEQQGYVKRVIR